MCGPLGLRRERAGDDPRRQIALRSSPRGSSSRRRRRARRAPDRRRRAATPSPRASRPAPTAPVVRKLTSPENGKSVKSDVATLAAEPIARPNSEPFGGTARRRSARRSARILEDAALEMAQAATPFRRADDRPWRSRRSTSASAPRGSSKPAAMIGRALTGASRRAGRGRRRRRAGAAARAGTACVLPTRTIAPVEAANPSMCARSEIFAGRQLVEREPAALVGDGAGERDAERRDHRAAEAPPPRSSMTVPVMVPLSARAWSLARRRRADARTALRVRREAPSARPPRRRRTPPKRIAGQAFHGSFLRRNAFDRTACTSMHAGDTYDRTVNVT